jgi:hypothetical protein
MVRTLRDQTVANLVSSSPQLDVSLGVGADLAPCLPDSVNYTHLPIQMISLSPSTRSREKSRTAGFFGSRAKSHTPARQDDQPTQQRQPSARRQSRNLVRHLDRVLTRG